MQTLTAAPLCIHVVFHYYFLKKIDSSIFGKKQKKQRHSSCPIQTLQVPNIDDYICQHLSTITNKQTTRCCLAYLGRETGIVVAAAGGHGQQLHVLVLLLPADASDRALLQRLPWLQHALARFELLLEHLLQPLALLFFDPQLQLSLYL
jgi:hypothetical protein